MHPTRERAACEHPSTLPSQLHCSIPGSHAILRSRSPGGSSCCIWFWGKYSSKYHELRAVTLEIPWGTLFCISAGAMPCIQAEQLILTTESGGLRAAAGQRLRKHKERCWEILTNSDPLGPGAGELPASGSSTGLQPPSHQFSYSRELSSFPWPLPPLNFNSISS